MAVNEPAPFHLFWAVFGIVGGIIFYSRFYVQWIYSELQRRSVVPPVFWYQSCLGSVMLMAFAVYAQSPLGALSQCLNLVPYSRNLIHIWREQGRLSRRRNWITHGAVGVIAVAGLAVVAWLWWREYQITSAAPSAEQRQTWFWLAIGVAGQALFASRFLIQWIVSEVKRKSVVPTVFWYISLVASVLQFMTFYQRGQGELVYAAGLAATMVVYVRNLWLIHTRPEQAQVTAMPKEGG